MNINITIANKHCTVQGTPVIVCGNSDYTLTFDFDAEWDQAAEKTARFAYIREGIRRYQDVKLTGNTVAVPAVYGTRELLVGVYAADIVTSTPARIPCEKSIICSSKAPEELYPGQYDQLRTELTEHLDSRLDAMEKTLPGFTESGLVVTCEPPGGYPLNVTVEDGATQIIRCGKNLFGGGAFESKLLECGGTKNESDDSVTIGGANVNGKIIFDNFKENTQYTFFFDMKAKSDGVTLNLRIEYSDGTSYNFYKNNSSQRQTHVYVSTKGKTVLRVVGIHYTQVTIYCNTCGIFEGNVAIENFEAYQGGTFAPGEKIPALPGVNTLWADTGSITVAGKADPAAIIEKLTNAIIALGGNV